MTEPPSRGDGDDRKWLLALETSGRSGSVALARASDERMVVVDEELLDPAFGSARTLAPAIERLLLRNACATNAIGCIGVIQGPGSFTGLRVGAATAKVMAWALGIPLVAVDTLDVIATQVASRVAPDFDVVPASDTAPPDTAPPETVSLELLTVIDAYRGQLFAARYVIDGIGVKKTRPTGIVDIDTLCEQLEDATESRLLVAGPGTEKLMRSLTQRTKKSAQRVVNFLTVPEATPMASTVATLAWKRWEQGLIEDVLGFLPLYYRSSAAEEKLT